jgi:hypothetical protein
MCPLQGRYLTQTQNEHKQTSIPWVGFEPKIPVFKRPKTFNTLDGAATVIGMWWALYGYLIISYWSTRCLGEIALPVNVTCPPLKAFKRRSLILLCWSSSGSSVELNWARRCMDWLEHYFEAFKYQQRKSFLAILHLYFTKQYILLMN